MWNILLLLYFVTGSHLLSIQEFSVPDAVEYGENVTLKCKYELTPAEDQRGLIVKWWWTPVNGSSDLRHQLYQRIAGQPPQTTSTDVGVVEDEMDSISLSNVDSEYSGNYECEVSKDVDELRKHNDLTVYKLGDGPMLNMSVNANETEEEVQTVVVKCEAFDITPEPDLIIAVNGKTIEGEKDVQLESGLYDIEETVVLNKEEVAGADVTCSLHISAINVTHPYIDAQTFVDAPATSTTEDAEEASTTEAVSDTLQHNSSVVWSSCVALVAASFLLHFFAM